MFIPTVAGSIGTATASRRASVREESAQERAKSGCVVGKSVAWKSFKSIVFLICLIFLMIQSVDFLRSYYTYPTAIFTDVTLPKNIKLPAVTFCFRNTISFKDFCSYEPNRCERPSDMEEFCRKLPIQCKGNTTNLKIPIQDFWTRMFAQRYLFNDSYNYASLFWGYYYRDKTRTFIQDVDYEYEFLKCYSENLHLYQSRSEVKTLQIDLRSVAGLNYFSNHYFTQVRIELFYPIDGPKVLFSLHSPYVPINVMDLHTIRQGKRYLIEVQLEKEEHLLPPPYQTNCRDNGPSEDAKESTNPNSFQVCLEMCRSEYTKATDGCDGGMTMVSSPSDLCNRYSKVLLSEKQLRELEEKHFMCTQNCKQGCLFDIPDVYPLFFMDSVICRKLQYKYEIKETESLVPDEYSQSSIEFYFKNPEVTVLRHFPVYGSGDVFSHIGGLLGCWLGVSVFTFTDIMEKFFRNIVSWKRRFRKRRFTLRRFRKRRFTLRRFRKRNRIEEIQRAPQTSEIHQD